MNPFCIDGPAVISFSGGRTSGMMLRKVLDAHGGTLPADVHVLFANTGKEREETLRFVRDCGERWSVPIVWIEYTGIQSAPPGQRVREVSFETASRNGEPFSLLISEKQFLPNAVMRFCTTGLKVLPMRDWMRARGYEHWTNAVGLRYDEPGRVSKVRARDQASWDSTCPLYDARVAESDVLAFWRSQPFNLRLKRGEGNCDMCFLKGINTLTRFEREHPGSAAWWVEHERARGGSFSKGRTYLHVIARANEPQQPVLLGLFDEPDTFPCACTD